MLKLYKLKERDTFILSPSNPLAKGGSISGVLLSDYSSNVKIGHYQGTWVSYELSEESITICSKIENRGSLGGLYANGDSVIINNIHYTYSVLITKTRIKRLFPMDMSFRIVNGEHQILFNNEIFTPINKLKLSNMIYDKNTQPVNG